MGWVACQGCMPCMAEGAGMKAPRKARGKGRGRGAHGLAGEVGHLLAAQRVQGRARGLPRPVLDEAKPAR